MPASDPDRQHRLLPLVYLAALTLSVLGVLGAIDSRHTPYSGFFITPDNKVLLVRPGSPAEAAGLQLDDQLLASGGIDVNDVSALRRRPPAQVGDRRLYRVARNGGELDLEMTFSSPPRLQQALGWASLAVGLAFLGAGVWAYRKRAAANTWLVAVLGMTAVGLFVTAPSLANPAVRRILLLVPQLLGVFAPGVFLHLMLAYPRPKALLERRWTRSFIYGLCAVAAVLALGAAFQGGAVIGPAGVLMFATRALFLILGLAALAHSWARASPGERRTLGLNSLLAAVAVALLPNIASAVAAIVSPTAQLPGGAFYFLATILIPVALAIAVVKAAEAAPVPGPEPGLR